jgi:hypothetical protein
MPHTATTDKCGIHFNIDKTKPMTTNFKGKVGLYVTLIVQTSGATTVNCSSTDHLDQ